MNPFKYGCVVDGEFFCPRPELERQLRAFAELGQNVVVQGERRMGSVSRRQARERCVRRSCACRCAQGDIQPIA